jgi:hypothetical protein
MAEVQFTLDYAPAPGENVKKDVVISALLVEPTANQLWVGLATDVPTRRGTEIISAIDFLSSGIRDRHLIDYGSPDFLASVMVTAVSIDAITESNRRTSATLLGVTPTPLDIMIGMGDVVTAAGYKVMHEAALEQLKRAVIEWLHANG